MNDKNHQLRFYVSYNSCIKYGDGMTVIKHVTPPTRLPPINKGVRFGNSHPRTL